MSGALEAEPTLLERTASPWWTLWMAAVGAGVALAVGLVAFPIQGDARGVGICYSLYSSSIFQFAAWLTISVTSIFHYVITRKSCIGATQGATGNIILAIVILLGPVLLIVDITLSILTYTNINNGTYSQCGSASGLLALDQAVAIVTFVAPCVFIGLAIIYRVYRCFRPEAEQPVRAYAPLPTSEPAKPAQSEEPEQREVRLFG